MNIVCAADSGVDRFDDRGLDRAGGIGLNVAVHARRLCSAEDSVFVLAPVGDDAEGRVVRAAVERAGVIDRLVLRAGATPVQHITHAASGERLFTRYDEGVLRGFVLGQDGRDLIAAADILSTAGVARASTSSRRRSRVPPADSVPSTSRTRTTSGSRSRSSNVTPRASTSGCSASRRQMQS